MAIEWEMKTCKDCGVTSEIFNFTKGRAVCKPCAEKRRTPSDLEKMCRANEELNLYWKVKKTPQKRGKR